MKPDKFTVFQLFERERRYVVPLYQRPYVWSQEDQWEPLWQDIAEKADAVLELEASEQRESPRNHFLGAVVLNNIETFGKEVAAAEVIDGQQRLTTLQIFLAALRDLSLTLDGRDLTSGLRRVTVNDCLMRYPYEAYKVWPTNADRAVFESVMGAGSMAEMMRRYPQRMEGKKAIPRERLVEAYLYFARRIEEYCRGGGDGHDSNAPRGVLSLDRLTALFQVLRLHMQLVVIELEKDDDPQVIFETLNARGQPLLPSDLIRNFTFLQATRRGEDVDRLYQMYWRPYDEEPAEQDAPTADPFWKQIERQGRLQRPRIDLFMFHYLTYQTERDINISHLFQEYRDWWTRARSGASVEAELSRLQDYAALFRDFFVPDPSTRLGVFAERLDVLDTTTIYPVLLYLLAPENRVPTAALGPILTDLESFLIRRMICNLTTKNYNRLFLALLKKLRADQENPAQVVRTELLTGQGDAVRWPNDMELARHWLVAPVYTRLKPHRVAMVLGAIEKSLQTPKQEEILIVSKLSVEHVLPQDYKLHEYPLPAAENAPPEDERLRTRAELLHSFGNLTLLTTRLNSSLSNGPFRNKRPALAKQSYLQLNTHFQDLGDTWNEDDIVRRGLELLENAKRVWPYPLSS